MFDRRSIRIDDFRGCVLVFVVSLGIRIRIRIFVVVVVRVLQQVTIQFVFGVVGLFPDHGRGTFIKLRTRIDAINLLIPDDEGRRLMSSRHRLYIIL